MIPEKKRRKPNTEQNAVPTPRFAEAVTPKHVSAAISSMISSSVSQPPAPEIVIPPVSSQETQQPIVPPNNAPQQEGNAIPPDIFEWMQGKKTVPPAHLAKMMADISNKMGYYIAYVIIQRIGSLNSMLSRLEEVERNLFVNKNFTGMNEAQLFSYHSRLKHTVQDFMEFARRFSVEAKDIIIDPERDELVNLVRSLDADGLKAVKDVLTEIKKARTGSGAVAKEGISITDFEDGQGKM
jgi:succinate dehydrogenase flavin-adding protein (antitoxin of CptAB toxin-antitoxin module)